VKSLGRRRTRSHALPNVIGAAKPSLAIPAHRPRPSSTFARHLQSAAGRTPKQRQKN